MHPKTRHSKHLTNPIIKRWYENLKARSEITSDNYLRNLGLWLEWLNLTPEELIKKASLNYNELKNSISDHIRKMENEGKAGSYISTSIKPILSFLKFNNTPIKLQINIKNENRNLTTENERIPTKEELSTILRSANTRSRLAIALMAYSGLRPETIGTYKGDNGLKLSDIKNLKISNKSIEFEKIPTQITIRPELSKARHQYFTFLTSEGCTYMAEYLKERINSGEILNQESPLIMPDTQMSRKESENQFLETQLVSREIKKAILKAGFKWRPYVFRAYFATNLDIAESKGEISHPWRQFFMGHKGDIESTYSTKKKLSEDIIDQMRQSYKKCEKHFTTQSETAQEENITRKLRQYTITMFEATFNITLKADKKEELLMLSLENFQEELKRIANERKTEILNNGNKQKIISSEETEAYINQGWEYITTLPNGKVIIKIPET